MKRKQKRRKPRPRRRARAFREIEAMSRHLQLAAPQVAHITIALTANYVRRLLGLRASDPLAWRGRALRCIGSRRWREQRADWLKVAPK